MKRRELSRKQFLSLGVLSSLGVLNACTLEDPKTSSTGSTRTTGSGGAAGSSTGTTSGSGGSGGGTTTTTSSTGTTASSGPSGTGSGTGGVSGSGGTSTGTGGAGGGTGGMGGGSAGTSGGSAGKGGTGTGGTAGSGGSSGANDGGVKDGGGIDAGVCTPGAVATVSQNHFNMFDGPHYLLISPEDILAGVAKTYHTLSVPDANTGPDSPYPQSHEHFVRLTATDFMQLRAGMTVTKRSCDSHPHNYVFKCGAMPPSTDLQCGKDTCGTKDDPCP